MGNLGTLRHSTSDSLVGFGLLLSLAATAVLFWPATHGPFLFDDFANLRHLALLGNQPDLSSLGRYLSAFVGNPGRPLGALSFLIDDQAWPAFAAPFKQTNLLLHLLVGVCVFVLARSLVRLDPGIAHRAALAALAVTALWLISPMQLAATMLVVQRMNILSALFTIIGLIAYVAALRRGRAWTALAALWCTAGLAFLCKENGVLAFAYAAVINHTLLRRDLAGQPRSVGVVAHAGTVLPLVAVALAMWLQADRLLASYQLRDFSLGERLMTEPRVLVEYVARILLPRLGGQGIFHDDYVVSTGLLEPLTTLPALLACVVAIVAGVVLRSRTPWLAFAILWFFAGHLLESTALPLELYFEHRNYLPMLGPLLGASAMLSRLSGAALKLGLAVAGLWVGMAGLSIGLNARAWGDELHLAHVWHAENPDSIRSTQFLARTLAGHGRHDLARHVLHSAYQRQPGKVELAFQIALLDCTDGRLDAEGIRKLQRLASVAPPAQSIDAAMQRLGNLAQAGVCSLVSEDWSRLADRLLANPAYASVGSLAGSLHYQKAVMAEHARDLNTAMIHYDQAFQRLQDARIPQRQAVLLASAGLYQDAFRYLALSDGAPSPLFKRLMFDPTDDNARIRKLVKAAQEQAEASPR